MPNKDTANTHHFLPMDDMMSEHHHPHPHHPHDSDLKWPNGLSFFTALTGRSDDAKLLFGHEGLASNRPQAHNMMHSSSQMSLCGNAEDDQGSKEEDNAAVGGADAEDHLGLDGHSSKARRTESGNKFKRSFTMPARMATSSSSSSLDQRQNQHHAAAASSQGMEYRSSEAGIYSDIMETFLE
ncbi:uncharacterized protein M6B38_417155 [Iris pallida]|uniref:Uncharacterized protein n=1 Tax=Iris pallida TaxID=29817 RepID=A0AAX6FJH5_IRIPA|nr:uncharacterized protein M6B38_417155 [Iris pallida]